MNHRDETEAYQEFLEQREREEEEKRQLAADELMRVVFSGHEVRGTTALGGAPVVPSPEASGADAEADGAEKRVGSADAGAHGIRSSRKRTAGEELYRAFFGHDHDNVVNSLADVEDYDPPPPRTSKI